MDLNSELHYGEAAEKDQEKKGSNVLLQCRATVQLHGENTYPLCDAEQSVALNVTIRWIRDILDMYSKIKDSVNSPDSRNLIPHKYKNCIPQYDHALKNIALKHDLNIF